MDISSAVPLTPGIIDDIDSIKPLIKYKNIIFSSFKLSIKLFLCIILIFPIVILSIVGVDGENFLYFLSYVLKYIFKQKLYLYEKNETIK